MICSFALKPDNYIHSCLFSCLCFPSLQVDLNKVPANFIAWPTEPFLKVTRVVVPPAFGVDISPIIWFAFLNFLKEILVSDQGILTILLEK